MGILNVDHPEIIDFITSKKSGGIVNFNISVGVTDEFMDAVEQDGPWTLRFGGKEYQTLPARKIWDLIAESAHACGDPGIIFLDALERGNPMLDRELNCTNPCWTGDTEILTTDGWQRFDDIVKQGATCAEVITVNDAGCYSIQMMRNIGITQESAVVIAVLVDGGMLKCTPNHNLYRRNMKKVQAIDIHEGEYIASIGGGAIVRGIAYFPYFSAERPVYNGTVDETHRYFVRAGNHAILSANCGEVPLSVGESCLLASIDLSKFVTPEGVDFDALRETTKVGVRFLDNLIDVGEYPLPIIDQMTKETRKIGLGITGLADTLITLGLPYDSERGRAAAEGIMSVIRETADKYAAELAEEKGNFPAWESSVYHFHYDTPKPRRNATCITIAPTGSVTTIAGCEGYGIEPIFAVAYQKATNVAGDFNVFSPLFLEKTKHLNLSQEILDKIAKTGSCQNVPEIPAEVQRLFRGAQEIAPEDHLLMQAALQKYVDNAVSKTINAPNSATVDDIKQMYLLAHQKGLKGITVFRDGCKDGVIKIGESGASGAPTGGLARGVIEPRPVTADGETTCLRTGCGKLYLTTNFVDNRPIETFISTGSKGGCQAYTEATSRLISLALRGGISVEDVCEQLNSTHPCASYQLARGQGRELAPGKSCASAIARKLLKYVQGERKEPEKSGEKCCPMCGEPYKRAEGCFVCVSCGYSEC